MQPDDNNTAKIQMGQLTSNITVIDEDELLTPAQLDKIANQVMAKLEQKMARDVQRQQEQGIERQGQGFRR